MEQPTTERTEDIIRLWARAAPEREAQLKEIMAQTQPAFMEAEDKPEMLFEAGTTMIRYNQRTLDAKWLLAHAAWQAIEAYSGVLACLAFCRQPDERAHRQGQGRAAFQDRPQGPLLQGLHGVLSRCGPSRTRQDQKARLQVIRTA